MKITENNLNIYEKGFEDGYAMAKRLYKIYMVDVRNENGEILTTGRLKNYTSKPKKRRIL